MDMTIDQQVALDEALVPHASRLRIGKSNFRLTSDITSKESTLQVATATVHHHSTCFKMNNKKCIFNLEYFREMLHICLRIPKQTFNELPFEEEILAFLRNLGHSGETKKITDKSTGYDSLQLSQAQILWGMYHKKNVDFAYLLCEDYVYQVEHKYAKKSNEMYYPRFTKMFMMIKLVSRHQNTQQFGTMLHVELTNEDIRNSATYKEYYTIASGVEPPKTKSSVRNMQSSSYTTMRPPMDAGIRLSTSAKGKQPAKSSKAKGLYVLSEVALTEAEHMKLGTKKACKKLTSIKPVDLVQMKELVLYQGDDEFHNDQEDEDDQDDNDDDQDSDNDDDNFVHPKLSTNDEEATVKESFNPIVQTPSHKEKSDDKCNDDANHDMNVGGYEGPDAEDNDKELYGDVNINLEGRESSCVSSLFVLNKLNPSPDAGIDSIFESTTWVDVPVTTTVVPLLVTAPTLPPPSIPIISQVQQAPAPSPKTAPSTSLQDLLNFGSLFGFDNRLKTLEANFSEFMQTNQFAKAVSSIVDRYIDHRLNEAVK
uniref:Uncharacterized protein n=1 Tax=Tanacetum cinerariifolium TaxID=118510 RepID=A0A6L2LWQ4_TANCI|nr:hypothetical protein [Tanacetum cinerariifolium]